MKVTKLKNGCRIRLTDNELELLQVAVAALDPKGLTGDVKSAYTRRRKGGDILRIDVDQSKAPNTRPQNFDRTPPAA